MERERRSKTMHTYIQSKVTSVAVATAVMLDICMWSCICVMKPTIQMSKYRKIRGELKRFVVHYHHMLLQPVFEFHFFLFFSVSVSLFTHTLKYWIVLAADSTEMNTIHFQCFSILCCLHCSHFCVHSIIILYVFYILLWTYR